jgi:hypothetical protein
MKHEYDPYPFERWYIRKFGLGRFDELHARHDKICKLSNYDLEHKLAEIQLAYKLKKLEKK